MERAFADCVRVVRGLPGMVERMVVEIPYERGFDLGALTIAGSPLRYGGQIAECITVKLAGVANILPVPEDSPPTGINARGMIDPFNPRTVDDWDPTQPLPPGVVEAFLNQGKGDSTSVQAPSAQPMVTRTLAAIHRAKAEKT